MDSSAPSNLILWYTVDKHPNAFWLSIPSNSEISELKSAICLHLKDGPLHAKVPPQELILWKLTIQVLISLHETVGERVKAMHPEEIAMELKNDNQKVSQAFPEFSDTEQELHLIVHIGKPSPPPSTTRSSSPWTLLDNAHISASTIENLPPTDEDALLIDAGRLIDATRAWEEEKLELERAREEALARVNTADESVKTLSDDLETVRQCNIKYRIRILEQELRGAAVKEAKNKASKATSDTTNSWESEKLELQKSRDEALARADASDESVKKLSRDVTFACEHNERYQSTILGLQTVCDRMKLEHAAAVEESDRKAASAASDAAKSWEFQKIRLERARDKAVIRADKGEKLVKKLLLPDTCKCNHCLSKMIELQSAWDRDRDKDSDTAVVENDGASTSPSTEEPSTKHGQDLKTLHAQVTVLHEASLKAAADAATMAAKVEAAAAASDKSMQTSLKAAADAAIAHVAKPRAPYFSQSDAVAASVLHTNPANSAATHQVATTASAVSRGGLRGRVRVAPRGAVGDSITRSAAPGGGGAPPYIQSVTTSGARASTFGSLSKQSREGMPETEDDSLTKRLKPAATTTTPKRHVTVCRSPSHD